MQDDLPFKVVRTSAHDEIIARAVNLPCWPRSLRDRKAALSAGPDRLWVRSEGH